MTQTTTKKRADDISAADWQTIGWQGITVQLPAGWALTGFGGTAQSGTLRCDSAEPESAALPVGMELRWISTKRAPKEASVRSRAEALIESVTKAAKKAKVAAESSIYTADNAEIDGREPAFRFAWRTDRAAAGRIWYCSKCARTIMVQVYGLGGKPFVAQAEAILASIRCHSDEPGWQTWGLYDLVADVPSVYTLESQKVMNIYLQLKFRRGRSTDILTVEQWSLANVQLKGAYLDEWFERKRDEMVAGIEIEKSETTVNGHDALSLDGRRGGVMAAAEGIKAASKLKLAAPNYCGVLWECPGSNKAYLVQSISRRPDAELVKATAERVRCHRAGKE